MKGKGNADIVVRDLREFARGDATTDGFKMILRHHLLQQTMDPLNVDAAAVHSPATPERSERSRSAAPNWIPVLKLGMLPRWGVVLTAALLVIVLAGTGYATEPIINQLFDRSPDTNQPLGQAFNLSQTVNGYTMTLSRAYADRQFIIVGYTVSGPGGRVINGLSPMSDGPGSFPLPSLTDGEGHDIRSLGGSGYNEGTISTYSGATISAGATQITLHLRADVMQMPQPGCSAAACSMVTVKGPWTFTFTIPVAPSRIGEPQQTVRDGHGWPVTLERVAITPTQVGVTLRGAGTEASVELIAGGKHYALVAPGGYDGADAGIGRAMKECFAQGRQCPDLWKSVGAVYGDSADLQDGHVGGAVTWARELQNQHGEWTLIVTASPQAGKLFQPQGGPWVFHFTMP